MPVARPSLTPADAAAFASQRLRRNVGMAFCFIAILLLINWNAKNLSTPSTGLGIGNSKAQASISRKGFVRLPSGATVRTASADQGDNQCISKFSTDTKTAQCQAFCNVKFRKFHCVWCKCVPMLLTAVASTCVDPYNALTSLFLHIALTSVQVPRVRVLPQGRRGH